MIDTHCHIDGEEFAQDLEEVITRAKEAGVQAIGVPGIDLKSCVSVMALCERYSGFCYPMLGLHPEEVKANWKDQLAGVKMDVIATDPIAIGEIDTPDDPLP